MYNFIMPEAMDTKGQSTCFEHLTQTAKIAKMKKKIKLNVRSVLAKLQTDAPKNQDGQKV